MTIREPDTLSSPPPVPDGPAGRAMPGAHYALGLLLTVYVVNHIDRQIMSILVEPVRAEFGLSDTQIGLLIGGAVAIFYTFAGIPIARWADRANRRNIISVALLIWSAMTVASGYAKNFLQLLGARIGVGIGEAGCTPPAHSLISDYFPAERRGTALAIYQLGVPLGMLFGLGFGGYLADQMGWRTAFLVVGAPGVLLALITRFTLREPPRGQADVAVKTELEPLPVVLRFMWRLPALRHMMIGASLQTLALAAWGSFNPAYLQRVHGLSGTEAGLALGLIAGVAGTIATFGSGWIGDRLARRDPRWYFWLPAIGAIFSLPFTLVAYTTGRSGLAIAMILGATLGHYFYSALSHVVAQSLVRPRMRATMSAIALFMMNIVGFGIGPAAIGALSDAFGGGTQLRYAMLGFTVFMAWAAIHYVLGARSYRADLEAKHAD